MKSILFTLLTTLFTVNSLHSQTYLNAPEKPFIEVNGTAEKEIIPDEIYIRIIIREKTENRDKASVEQQEKQLKDALKAMGISLEQLSVSDMNADYMRVGWGKREVIEKKDFTLLVSTATVVGKVFEKLDELEIREAYISKVDHSEIEKFRREMKIVAIKAAKEKANYLVSAIDQKLGAPQIIRENNSGTVPNILINEYKGLSNQSFGNADLRDKNKDVVQFQKIKLVSSIYVKFTIE